MSPLFVMRWAERDRRSAPRPPFDGRDLGDRLAEAVRAADCVRYVDADGRLAGRWSALLLRDATLLAAAVARHDRTALRRRHALLLAHHPDPGRGRGTALRDLGRAIAEERDRVEGWREAAGLGAPASIAAALRWALETAAAELASAQARLARLVDPETEIDTPGRVGELGAMIDATEAALATLADRAEPLIARSAPDRTHPPAAALHLLLAELAGVVQDGVNRLPARIADFHRNEVLGEPLRPARMDRVELLLSLPPGAAGEAVVPAGARFAATGPAGEPLVYAADHALQVTGARVGRLRMVRVAMGAGGPVAVLQTEVVPAADGTLAPGVRIDGAAAGGPEGAKAVALGLVVSCPELAMGRSRRRLALTFELLAAPPADAPSAAACLSVLVSTAEGWRVVAPSRLAFVEADLHLALELGPDTPALAPPAAGEPGHGLAHPALLLRLADTPPPGALAALAGLRVAAVTVSTSCEAVEGTRASVAGAAASPPTGVYPFGSPSRRGAYFEVSAAELAGKALTRLDLSVRWSQLPTQPDGFAGYYAQYVVGPDRALTPRLFDNAVFQGRADLFGGGALAAGASGPFPLFAAYEEAGEATAQHLLAPESRYGFALEPGAGEGDRAGEAPRLRITLAEPAYGFGEDLYVPNLIHASLPDPAPRRSALKALIDRIAPERRPSAPQAVTHPNPPWRPQIDTMTLGYAAERRIRAEDPGGETTVLSLGPFEEAAPVTCTDGSWPLLALPDVAGTLAAEVLDLAPGARLALLLRLDVAREAPSPGACWSAACASLRDDTRGLARSGWLSVRRDPDAPAGALWVRAAFDVGAGDLPRLVAVGAHALSATRVDDGGPGPAQALPPGSVQGFAPGAAPSPAPRVRQPWPSTGGRRAETQDAPDPWLPERLRHRARADCAWDYERLALDSSQAVGRVRALPPDGSPGRPAGRVTVVAAPAAGLGTPLGSEELDAVAAQLEAASGAMARVHVTAPDVVRVGVDAEVVLDADAAPGELAAAIDVFLTGGGVEAQDLRGEDALREALRAFVSSRSYVRAVVSLSLRFDRPLDGLAWVVPAGGAHRIADLSPA